MIIAAFDPGVTTGIAIYDNEADQGTNRYRAFQVRPDLYPNPHDTLYEVINTINPDLIIYEPFHFRQGKTGAVFTGIEYIGILQLWQQRNKRQIKIITPSDGKGFWSDAKIRRLGLWHSAATHAMDAIRILLRHLMKDKEWLARKLPLLRDM